MIATFLSRIIFTLSCVYILISPRVKIFHQSLVDFPSVRNIFAISWIEVRLALSLRS